MVGDNEMFQLTVTGANVGTALAAKSEYFSSPTFKAMY